MLAGYTGEMDAANRQLSQRLVQPVGLVGGLADRQDLDAQARVGEGIESIGGGERLRGREGCTPTSASFESLPSAFLAI
jgi:hypothetical protein